MRLLNRLVVARSMWLLPDMTVVCRWMTQRAYLRKEFKRPAGATFQMAVGGIPVWKAPSHVMWATKEKADDPLDRGWSLTDVLMVNSTKRNALLFHRVVENHHSVTFDIQDSSGINSGTSITRTVPLSSSTGRYICVSTVSYNGTAPSGITYAGAALSLRTSAISVDSNGQDSTLYDKVGPASGSNDVIVTFASGGAAIMGVQAAIGVAQTSTITDSDMTHAQNTAPTMTLTSATGEMCFTQTTFYDGNAAISYTPDASWTTDHNLRNSAGDFRLCGSHKAGGSSVTRTDTIGTSTKWVMTGVALAQIPVTDLPLTVADDAATETVIFTA